MHLLSKPKLFDKMKGCFSQKNDLQKLVIACDLTSISQKYKKDEFINYEKIIKDILMPYFCQEKAIMKQNLEIKYKLSNEQFINFKILHCQNQRSYEGYVSKSTQIYFCQNYSFNRKLEKITLRCLTHQMTVVNKNILEYYIHERKLNLIQNQIVQINDDLFFVSQCYPNSGEIDNNTQVEFEYGLPPSIDYLTFSVEKNSIDKYYNTLGQEQKQKFSKQSKLSILKQYFLKTYFFQIQTHPQILSQGQQIEINNIKFKVKSCNPLQGVINYNTKLQLVFEEDVQPIIQQMYHQVLNSEEEQKLDLSQQQHSQQNQQINQHNNMPEEEKVDEILPRFAHNPSNQQVSIQINELMVLLSQIIGTNSNVFDPDFKGATQRQINQLPTMTLTKDFIEKNEISQNQCSICLIDYKEGDEIKYMPCFDFFHKKCIDEWLCKCKLCPNCKTPCDQTEIN